MSTMPDLEQTSVPVSVPVDHSPTLPNLDANQPRLDDAVLPAIPVLPASPVPPAAPAPPVEIGGRPGPDPTRYGDWEKNGRCIDF